MGGIEVMDPPAAISLEHGDSWVLISFTVFASEIVLEGIGAATQKSQLVPAAFAGMRSQVGRIGCSHNGQVHVLRKMVGNPVESVDKHRAHRTRIGLLLTVHEVINDQGSIICGEELAQSNGLYRGVAVIEIRRTFLE